MLKNFLKNNKDNAAARTESVKEEQHIIEWNNAAPHLHIMNEFNLVNTLAVGDKCFCLFVLRRGFTYPAHTFDYVPHASAEDIVMNAKVYAFYVTRMDEKRFAIKFFDGRLAGIVTVMEDGSWDVKGKRMEYWRDPYQTGCRTYSLADAGESLWLPDMDKLDKDVSHVLTSQYKDSPNKVDFFKIVK